MTIHISLARRLQYYSHIASLTVAAIGLGILLVWIVDPAWQAHRFPDFPPMKFNTALCFAILGLTMSALPHIRSQRRRQIIVQFAGYLILLVASVTLAEILLERNLGIDELMLDDPASSGRMAPLSAVFFVLNGLALVFMADQPTLTTHICAGAG